MGQVLHGSANATEAVRRAIQLCKGSVRAVVTRYEETAATFMGVPCLAAAPDWIRR